MARIRSIKPEFWTDEKVAKLSDHAALLFIGIWNHADDKGHFPCSPSALALLLPRWRAASIQPMLSRLEKDGLVRCSREAGVGLVVGWGHQRIDKPRASKWEGKEIQWDTPEQSKMIRESSKINPRKDRIGEDRIGEDRNACAPGGVGEPAPGPVVVPKKKPSSSRTWSAYSAAYERRYGERPVRNASVSAKLVQFVQRVGEGEAPDIAAFYMTHNDAFYVRSGHPVGLLLKDAEKLRTEWATGRKITWAAARVQEQRDENAEAVKAYLAEKYKPI